MILVWRQFRNCGELERCCGLSRRFATCRSVLPVFVRPADGLAGRFKALTQVRRGGQARVSRLGWLFGDLREWLLASVGANAPCRLVALARLRAISMQERFAPSSRSLSRCHSQP